ncbi:MAG: hypothetical protein GC184_06085 [Rhizobiales bacterium]|nr:hypothetical protein [Hyphomicrobiales bacterium]
MSVTLADIVSTVSLIITGLGAIAALWWKLHTQITTATTTLEDRLRADLAPLWARSEQAVHRDEIARLEGRFDKLVEMSERERDRAESRHTDLIHMLTRVLMKDHNGLQSNN